LSTAVPSIGTTLDASGAALQPAAGTLSDETTGRALPRAPLEPGASAPARTRWWVEALTIAWLCWIYDAVTNLAPLRLNAALEHGRDILSTERSLGIAPEHALDRWLAARHSLAVLVSYYYDNAHFIVTLGVLAFMWWRRADIYRPLRNALVLINVVAFVVFWRYPVAPPRMLGGYTDVVAASHALGSWHTGALASDANQLAAMPSLHLAWAVWSSVAIWRITRRPAWRAAAVVYPLLTGFAVLATGNHYVLDGLAGASLAALAVSLTTALVGGAGRWRARSARKLAPAG
jgi:hypothetical protein